MATAIAAIRSAVFLFLFHAPFTIFWACLSLSLVWLLPKKYRHFFVVAIWAKITMFCCRWILGIRYELKGLEHLNQPGVIVSNHQSSWETYFLQTLVSPQTQVIKKQLLTIPFFGWAFRLINPIAIDRDDPRAAMTQVLDQGKQFLSQGIFVLIFPEGTRKPPGQLGRFSRGGAVLAKEADVPMIPISQNSGNYWINKKFIRYPGSVQVTIHPPVFLQDMTAEQGMEKVRDIIASELQQAEAVPAS